MGEGTISRFRRTRWFAREAAAPGPIESYEFDLLRDSKVVSQSFSRCTRDAAVRFRSELAFMIRRQWHLTRTIRMTIPNADRAIVAPERSLSTCDIEYLRHRAID
jgi:hypothetical protein